ncbi:MAG: hypothetical protein WC955_01525 [Elusimicrobiota bacterium]
MDTKFFSAAQSVWPAGQEKEMNLLLGLYGKFDVPTDGTYGKYVLLITGATFYRIYLNGVFLHHGPARGPHGWHRVDELDITTRIVPGINHLAIEVLSNNVNTYYFANNQPFIQAEVQHDFVPVLSTGKDFVAYILNHKIKKVLRYSFQRAFTEAYTLTPDSNTWRTGIPGVYPSTPCAVLEEKQYLPRRVPLPVFEIVKPIKLIADGITERVEAPNNLLQSIAEKSTGKPNFLCYTMNDLELNQSLEYQRYATKKIVFTDKIISKVELTEKSFGITDFGRIYSGFIGAEIICNTDTVLMLTFCETLRNNDIDLMHPGTLNILYYSLKPGRYSIESLEPYTLKYLKFLAISGTCSVENMYIREYTYPLQPSQNRMYKGTDPEVNTIFSAAVETFKQNCPDVFMDCPSRERGAWLCDSFFTARTAYSLTGKTDIEQNFLENYVLPSRFPPLPTGMFPMCYPADHPNGRFIPNWALWLVLQLEEYLKRSGDTALIAQFEQKVYALFDYFKKFLNSDGLLEKLESWIFVEWSLSNKFVQDINYPSNMLYAAALKSAGNLYNNHEFLAQAEEVKNIIRAQSFDGTFFVDNALRGEDGKLNITTNHTETCQYYAFYFGIATPDTQPALWKTLLNSFGPERDAKTVYPELPPSNLLIGYVLRMELLSRYNEHTKLMRDLKHLLLPMANLTGTLWEHVDPRASCDHAFASHAAHIILRDFGKKEK